MYEKIMRILVIVALLILGDVSAFAEIVTTSWGGDAGMIYDTGFMHMLMKHPEGGVSLFEMDLIQNDAPGAAVPSPLWF